MVHQGRLKGVCSDPPLQRQAPSAVNDTKDNLHHPSTVFMPALSRIMQENKTKREEGKWTLFHFLFTQSVKTSKPELFIWASPRLSFLPHAKQLHLRKKLNALLDP